MTDANIAGFANESAVRLKLAEQKGLRLAIACRTVVTGAAFLWYGAAPFFSPGFEPRIAAIFVLLLFTLVGIGHLCIIGSRFDRWWMKYAVYSLDTLAICATFAVLPISRADDVPQIIAFRAYGIYFLFPLLAVSCLSLSWRLVLWTGAMCVVGWWAAFLWVISGMDHILSWGDIPSTATQEDYENVFLSIDFIGRGNRIEETAMIFFATVALAVAVYRARAVFFAQVAADLDWRHEKTLRERVSQLLGKYLPEEIAQKLIAEDAPLKPQRTRGVALVMDIAGFTRFSADNDPEHVIGVLDRFLADATTAVTRHGGIVISYLGDGILVTFNAPVQADQPQTSALRAASDLIAAATAHGFSIRIGIASGDLVTGIIGSEARQSFTVYGDAVNLASRLEALAKIHKVQVLIDKATYDALNDPSAFTSLGSLQIAGLSERVETYALVLPDQPMQA